MIGTLEEAKEIYDTIIKVYAEEKNVETAAPEGWKYIGAGSSRIAFQGPSGAVYKIERHSNGDDYNKPEQVNFDHLRNSGTLPEGWRVPDSSLYAFETLTYKYTGWNRPPKPLRDIVKVIALEFVKGEVIPYEAELRDPMHKGMHAVNMVDGARGNVLKTEDGYCIVDLGEHILPDSAYENVVFAKLGVAA